METMTETGTEKRVDGLSNRVDDLRVEMHRGFDRVDANAREMRSEMTARFDRVEANAGELRSEMTAGFERVDTNARELRSETNVLRADMKAGFDSLNKRMDSVQRLMIGFFATTLGGIVAAAVVTVLTHH